MLWSSNLGPLVFRHHIWHNSSLEYHTGMKFTQKWILYEMQITGTWWRHYPIQNTHTHTHLTALFPGLPRWAGTRKVKPIWIFTEARDSEWQWHQLGHMQVCTSLHTDNHANTPPLSFLQAGCPSCRPTNSVKALKAEHPEHHFKFGNWWKMLFFDKNDCFHLLSEQI